MSDPRSLKVDGASSGEEHLEELGRPHQERLQAHARNLVGSLYMMVRSAQLYDAENQIFDRPLELAKDTINWILASDGKLQLQVVKDSIYLNNMLVRVDVASLENVRWLCEEMRRKDVGGFTLLRPTTVSELQSFIAIFAQDQDRLPDEDGLSGRKLVTIKITSWRRLKEKLHRDELTADELKVDRKRYALLVYARGVLFLRKYFEKQRAGRFMTQFKVNRVVQDLIDVSFQQRTHFLGMTTLGSETEYLAYHSMNTALMSIVFGSELGFSRVQLRELASTALFHDSGMATLPQALLDRAGALDPDERREVARGPLRSVQHILREKGISKGALLRVVTTHEHKTEFGTAVRDSRGAVEMIIPRQHIGLYARVIGICCVYDSLTSRRPFRDAYGPEIALTLMWTELRHKFDPELLRVFMRVMSIQPIKVLGYKG